MHREHLENNRKNLKLRWQTIAEEIHQLHLKLERLEAEKGEVEDLTSKAEHAVNSFDDHRSLTDKHLEASQNPQAYQDGKYNWANKSDDKAWTGGAEIHSPSLNSMDSKGNSKPLKNG